MASTVAADTIETIVPFLAPLAATVTTMSRASPADAAKIQTAMAGVQAGVVALAASDTAAASKPIVDRIEQDACAVLAAAAAMPLPFPYSMILVVASGLLPSLIKSVHTLMDHKVTVPTSAAATLAAVAA